MASTNLADPISQAVLNNSFIGSPFSLNTFLSVIVLIAIYLMWRYIDELPKRIHKEAIAQLENKLAIELTEIKSRLDKETELLKILRAQVEPKKVETYMAIADLYGAMFAPQFIDQNLSPSEQKKDFEWKRFSFKLQSKLFFFASDTTIERFIAFKNNSTSPQATDLFSSFMVSMRQDLHEDTHLTTKDFMSVIWTLKKDIEDKK